MHPNEELLHKFYKAFQAKDAETMASCYASDVRFSDPVFQNLRGSEAGDMWRMLTSRGKDLTVEYSAVLANDTEGSAHWEAKYTFSATGKFVHNIIDARFRFRDGKIVEHDDDFALQRWMGLAFGVPGKLFGWIPPVQNAFRKKARSGLDAWRAKRR